MKRLNVKKILIAMILIISMVSIQTVAIEELQSSTTTLKLQDIEKVFLEKNPTLKINNKVLEANRVNIRTLKDLEDMNDSYKSTSEISVSKFSNSMETLPLDVDLDSVSTDDKIVIEAYFDHVQKINDYIINELIMSASSYGGSSKKTDRQITDSEEAYDKAKDQFDSNTMQQQWAMQNMFINCFNLDLSIVDMNNQIQNIKEQSEIIKSRVKLGYMTEIEQINIENQLYEMQINLENMKRQKEDLLANINLMIDNEFDAKLELLEPSIDEIRFSLKYDEDLKICIDNSYVLKLAQYDIKQKNRDMDRAEEDKGKSTDEYQQAKNEYEIELIKNDMNKKQLKYDFDKLYNDIQSKEKAWNLEQKKLLAQKKIYDENKIKYNLGLITKVQFEDLTNQYAARQNAVKLKEYELIGLYLKYDWMKNGIKI